MRLASFGSGLVLAFSAVIAAFGCSTNGTAPALDAAICPLGQSHYYTSAGCNTTAPAPVCQADDPYGDTGCTGVKKVCTCDGVSPDGGIIPGVTETTSCAGYAKSAFQYEGACTGDAGIDAAGETSTDAGSDAASDATDATSSG